ncbi:RdgB/HAM1 family non-canonical purine NTP pyrophosphatase [Quadrisphaera sp. DSM 44207]|uniref:RdgB/HAM1 family non-canonical purine NTP pyrophosphatase n=1 Tax=Quadrisphaera sp. DSM 44207 TaxID=1881057 RepID=UPI00087F5820|nr:RdgB/HAM1 family non-canonical purine NTP pyrophosphatase [Quadrisphaera sp. DSM 44207]SDQ07399.1 XTP/dITP diphosphohydrolase [Quadrisphaera sp. DSM 44207]
MTARLVLATRNAHKVGELRSILTGSLGGADVVEVLAAGDLGLPDVPETGVTFAENALLKARAVVAATGLPAVADDSGIAVDVLGGSPGIFSARWCGRHGDDAANLALLLAQVADVPDEHRGAEFVCAAALVTPDGAERVELGRLRGALVREPRGSGGFGYDPALVPQGLDVTCAELSAAQKEAISHRGRAFRALAPQVASALGLGGAPEQGPRGASA